MSPDVFIQLAKMLNNEQDLLLVSNGTKQTGILKTFLLIHFDETQQLFGPAK